jgi:cytosine/adenosine deaminase-related metal-dependent hydrolase
VLLVSADWVLPVTAPAVPAGAVLIDGDRVVAVGPLEALQAQCAADTPREHFGGCVITPGLVNAHTHLTLSALAGVAPPAPFHEWLASLVGSLAPWEIADHEASGVIGAEESLASGVTAVGDIAYGAAEVASASKAGLGGVYYWELLGIAPEKIADQLAYLRYPRTPDAFGPRVVCGLSPHAPYTSGPALMRSVYAEAARRCVPFAVHVAESAAEFELMHEGTGPLAGVASRQAHGFTAPHVSTVAYLDSLGALEGATAVHCCRLEPGDIETLAARGANVVTCPRSNRYLDNPPALVAPLLEAGIRVGIGTDSSASNHDLDLMAEVRALHAAEPTLAAETLLRIATAHGAVAIGVADRFGALATGMQADLAVFAVGPTDAPADAVVERGGRPTVGAVMSGGVWRVRDGELLARDPAAAVRAADARRRSVEALSPTTRPGTLS